MNATSEDFGKVAVLMGGRSAEREVSLMSGQGVLAALRSRGVDAHAFDPGVLTLTEFEVEKFDRAFIVLHGRYGEDGVIQGVLEQLDVPYTGSGVMASAVALNKVKTKQIWASLDLPTSQFMVLQKDTPAEAVVAQLGLPLIVKPAHEGSTVGLTKVKRAEELAAAYALAAGCDTLVLAEEFVAGRELTVAVLGEGATARALPIVEIVAPDGNYDYQNKYFTDVVQYHCPAALDEVLAAQVARMAVEAYRAVDCSGWGRVDVMLGPHNGRPMLLEVNTSPGMTGHSLVPMAARAAGMSYEDVCVEILRSARLKTGKRA